MAPGPEKIVPRILGLHDFANILAEPLAEISTKSLEHQQYPMTGRQQYLKKRKNINLQITGQFCSHAYVAR